MEVTVKVKVKVTAPTYKTCQPQHSRNSCAPPSQSPFSMTLMAKVTLKVTLKVTVTGSAKVKVTVQVYPKINGV